MHSLMFQMARGLALIGGAVLFALIILTCLSVLGREINATMNGVFFQDYFPQFATWVLASGVGPVNGDFELVEAGIAFAIFSFLPLCQITSSHATVDIFTSKLSEQKNRFLLMIADIVFAIVFILILWRLFEGTISKYSSGETTFLLQFPVWWGYVLSLASALVAAIIGVFVAYTRILEFKTGANLLANDEGIEH